MYEVSIDHIYMNAFQDLLNGLIGERELNGVIVFLVTLTI